VHQLKKRLCRKATIIELREPPRDANPLASLFGVVLAGLPAEGWPECCGAPMLPVLQLNLTEAPYVPEGLEDVAFVALFVDRNNVPSDGAANGACWLLRTYDRLEGLSAMTIPPEFERRRPRSIRYRLLERDLPDYDDAADLDGADEFEDVWEDEFGAAEGSKLGGWPSLLQSEIFWAPNNEHPADPQYVFQLARLERITPIPADTVLYFGRGSCESRPMWTLAWQRL